MNRKLSVVNYQLSVVRILLAVSVFLVLVIGLSGCVGYRLGTSLPPGINSVHVPTFVNHCGEPLVETETTKAAIQEFQKDGTLRVADADKADAILEVTLVDYKLEPLRYEKDEAKTTKEYRLKITADIVFKRILTDEILVEKQVEGESTFEPAGDLTSSKRSALPEAAGDLAHDIVESVVEYW